MTQRRATINSLSSTKRQTGAEYLLHDSGAQLHACPIKYPGKKEPLHDHGIHTASGARLQHNEGRNNPSAFLCVRIFSLLVARSAGYCSDLRADTQVHCSLLTRSRPVTAKHNCTRKRVCCLSKKMLMVSLVTAGVSDGVAQEFQTPIGPHALEDVEEPTPGHPATFKDPGTPAQIVLDQHSLTQSPSQRDRDSPHRDQSKIDIVVPQTSV